MSATKRKRTDSLSPEEEPSATITRSEKIWFSDGNIILEAEGKQFRVHQSVLARHSSVFDGMFDVPQPLKEPTIEGCSIVHVSDQAKDWEHVLNALYDRYYHSGDEQPIPVIEAMVRLGYKYDFATLCQEAVSRLKAEYPASLELYKGGLTHTRFKMAQVDELIDLLKLAQDHDQLQSIQPCLFQEIHDTFVLENLVIEQDPRLPQLLRLTMAAGFTLIRETPVQTTYQWLRNLPFPGCVSGGRSCAQIGAKIYFDVFYDSDLAHGLDEWEPTWDNQLCRNCTARAKVAHLEGRGQYWKALPRNFGLESWEALKGAEA